MIYIHATSGQAITSLFQALCSGLVQKPDIRQMCKIRDTRFLGECFAGFCYSNSSVWSIHADQFMATNVVAWCGCVAFTSENLTRYTRCLMHLLGFANDGSLPACFSSEANTMLEKGDRIDACVMNYNTQVKVATSPWNQQLNQLCYLPEYDTFSSFPSVKKCLTISCCNSDGRLFCYNGNVLVKSSMFINLRSPLASHFQRYNIDNHQF